MIKSDVVDQNTKPESLKIVKLLYREKELVKMLGISRSTVWQWIKKKGFPKPFKIGACTFWKAQEIHLFIENIGGCKEC